MFIELTEVLVCPACREREAAEGSRPAAAAGSLSAQGLVARVDRLEGRRVLDGHLGCPHCDARYPIEEGVVRFAATGPDAGPDRADPGEAELLVPALLGLQEEASGYVLLGPGLAEAAPRISAAVEGVEVVALAGSEGAPREESGIASREATGDVSREGSGSAPGGGRPRVSLLWVEDAAHLPLYSGRFRGVALVGGTVSMVGEAVRILAPRGRLAILVPSEEAVRAVEGAPLETLAADPRAIVAARA